MLAEFYEPVEGLVGNVQETNISICRGVDIRICIWEKIAELRDQMPSLRRDAQRCKRK